ncbi:TetR/AcrR family transcriptional regulator [Pseudarthrobacter sp. NamE2]|uniref:TetR/AcrR family transcriptional regulator n=1 Tax=Pseudarthrobacter sp. NamE2 TaxID=2576838 RepID=UPI0010FEC5C5|nr:TetR/AcrR family transcriptional regulator [Pseudarthrobacter sp. NamE2]TLM81398.1 TetR/AcrR family transcriptional regulator [Pseudarthrobacter sp. NamE2]
MRESQRPGILEAGLRVAASSQGAAITLDAVASEAGVTKPGLMYHFPNRDALMVALVEYAACQLERRMADLLGEGRATVTARYRSYIQVAADGQNMRAEWALWFHSAYKAELQEAWARHLDPWLDIPAGTPPEQRARLATARLAADGFWAAQASGVSSPDPAERALILASILDLVPEGDAQ